MASYSDDIRAARLSAVASGIGNAGIFRTYSGTPPATINDALSGNTVLSEHTCGSPFGSVSGVVLTAGAIADDSSANATGTATFGRFFTSGGTPKVQISCGGPGSGAEAILNSASVQSGTVVRVLSCAITAGNA